MPAPPGRDRPEVIPLLKPPSERLKYFSGTDQRGRPIPRPELLDQEAQQIASEFASIPASQLRRFYSAVTTLKRQIEVDKSFPDEAIKARLALLKAHAVYAQNRVRNMPEKFVQFFVCHAHAVQDRRDFLHGFAPHFEAVVAYHKIYETRERT
jgi:CRISPR type III-A-associated protein Csm2